MIGVNIMSLRQNRRRLPQVEALESLIPLSGMAGAVPGVTAARDLIPFVQRTPAHTITLQGKAQGSYSITRGIPDTGVTYGIETAGRLTPLGKTAEKGQI